MTQNLINMSYIIVKYLLIDNYCLIDFADYTYPVIFIEIYFDSIVKYINNARTKNYLFRQIHRTICITYN